MKNEEDARALIGEWFVSASDIQTNAVSNTLTVKIYRRASPVHDRAIATLLDELAPQEFPHPETGAEIIVALVYSAIRASWEIRKSDEAKRKT